MFRNGLRESSGPTDMRVGAVSTLHYLRRVGGTLVGVATTIASVLRETSGPTDLTIGAITDGQFLKRVGATIVSALAGDFVGPASATDNAVVRFDGTTGKLGQNSLVTVDDSGNISLPPGAGVDGVDISVLGANAVAGPASATDNAIARYDGASGKLIQNSPVTVDDAGLLVAVTVATSGEIGASGTMRANNTGFGIICSGDLFMAGGKTVDGVDVSVLGANAVQGPASAVDDRIAVFSGSTGKIIADDGYFPVIPCFKTGDQTVSSTTPANCTGMTFAGLAAGTYIYRFIVFWDAVSAANGIELGVDYTGTVTATRYGATIPETATTARYLTAAADAASLLGQASLTTTLMATLEGAIAVSNGGTLNLQISVEVAAGNITVRSGSFGTLQRVS